MAVSRGVAKFLPGFLLRYAQKLRFPHLFLLVVVLFIVDFFVPDPVPFLDEIMLGCLTLLFSAWKRRDRE